MGCSEILNPYTQMMHQVHGSKEFDISLKPTDQFETCTIECLIDEQIEQILKTEIDNKPNQGSPTPWKKSYCFGLKFELDDLHSANDKVEPQKLLIFGNFVKQASKVKHDVTDIAENNLAQHDKFGHVLNYKIKKKKLI